MSFAHPAHKQIKTPLTLNEAKKKLMDLVARREQSENELRQKLGRHCEPTTVEETLTWARQQSWFSESELDKARRLVTAKWATTAFDGLDAAAARKLQAKIMRFLITRGYDSAVMESIITNDFKRNFNDEDTGYDEEC